MCVTRATTQWGNWNKVFKYMVKLSIIDNMGWDEKTTFDHKMKAYMEYEDAVRILKMGGFKG